MKYKRFNIINPYKDFYYLNKLAKLGKCRLYVYFPRFKTYVIKKPISFGFKGITNNIIDMTCTTIDKFIGTVSNNMCIANKGFEKNIIKMGFPLYTFLIENDI